MLTFDRYLIWIGRHSRARSTRPSLETFPTLVGREDFIAMKRFGRKPQDNAGAHAAVTSAHDAIDWNLLRSAIRGFRELQPTSLGKYSAR